MQRDIRQTTTFIEAQRLYLEQSISPETIHEIQQLNVSSDDRTALFTGVYRNEAGSPAVPHIFQLDLKTSQVNRLTTNVCHEKLPVYSPNGEHIAFLSDRDGSDNFQLSVLDTRNNTTIRPPAVAGWVENISWSPNSLAILLTVAGHGADKGSGQGAVPSQQCREEVPDWIPDVNTGNEDYRWRHLWIYDIVSKNLRKISTQDVNVWEAVWCGDRGIVAITSEQPGEEAWYSATLQYINPLTGTTHTLHTPSNQIAYLCASPSGQTLALVSAISSDRGVVAGDLLLIDINTHLARPIDSHNVDISCIQWLSESRLIMAGHRGFETLVLHHQLSDGFCAETTTEVWQSSEISGSGHYIKVSGLSGGDCLLIAEGFKRAPEIGRISSGRYHRVKSFYQSIQQQTEVIDTIKKITWQASDGLEIQGWLLRPKSSQPHPTVMDMHGGPVWQWRPHWLGRRLHILMLLKRGYAIFMPNPRGSSGRGQDYCSRVLGDLGGADSRDCLSGLDHLVDAGFTDASRIGLIGHSYGGYMAAWLIGQDQRFAAAVVSAPMINYISQHLLSNISHYVTLFLQDHYKNIGGKYLQRSPITYAHQVTTPTLSLCGSLDRCTPAAEAIQFHHALLENKVKSVLVNYPLEGHGIKGIPAMLDYATRIVAWISEHNPVTPTKAIGSDKKTDSCLAQSS